MATRRQSTALIAVAALAACSFSRPPVERTTYLLTAYARSTRRMRRRNRLQSRCGPMRAVPLYERKEFVYRVDGERVVSDFYNEFAESAGVDADLGGDRLAQERAALRVGSRAGRAGRCAVCARRLDRGPVRRLARPGEAGGEAGGAVLPGQAARLGRPSSSTTACSAAAWTWRPAIRGRLRPATTRRSRRSSPSSSGTWAALELK